MQPSETKKVSTTYCFYIRKHIKFSISNTEQRPSFFRRDRLLLSESGTGFYLTVRVTVP